MHKIFYGFTGTKKHTAPPKRRLSFSTFRPTSLMVTFGSLNNINHIISQLLNKKIRRNSQYWQSCTHYQFSKRRTKNFCFSRNPASFCLCIHPSIPYQWTMEPTADEMKIARLETDLEAVKGERRKLLPTNPLYAQLTNEITETLRRLNLLMEQKGKFDSPISVVLSSILIAKSFSFTFFGHMNSTRHSTRCCSRRRYLLCVNDKLNLLYT